MLAVVLDELGQPRVADVPAPEPSLEVLACGLCGSDLEKIGVAQPGFDGVELGVPAKVFEFPDPSVRIDYPVWSPDGRWVLFDRFLPKGGDIWMMDV